MAEKTRVEDPTGTVVARNLYRIRTGQNKTIKDVVNTVNATEEVPFLSELALGRIERQQRRLDIGELTALSFALGVPVVDLLTPSPLDNDLPAQLTGVTTDPTLENGRYNSEELRAWLRGDCTLDYQGILNYWESSRQTVSQGIERDKAALGQLRKIGTSDEALNAFIDSLNNSERRLAEIEERLQEVKDLDFLQ